MNCRMMLGRPHQEHSPRSISVFPWTGLSVSMAASHRLVTSLFVSAVSVLTFCGCSDDTQTVRKIQAQRHHQVHSQSKQDHVGEAFQLLHEFVDLNADSAGRQIAYHLNRWRDDRPDIDPVAVPDLLRTISELLPAEAVTARISRESFKPSDIQHLRNAYLFRQIIQWVDNQRCDEPLLADWLQQQPKEIGEEAAGQLRTATRLFDWTVRNVAYEPQVPTDPAPPPPPMPPGLTFRGAGYRQSDFQSIWRGTGDSLQRAGVFTQLCRQASIPAFVLSIQSIDTGDLKPWCVGVLVDKQVYLFETELGMYIPGPDQVGIATLAQARRDSSVLRRLNVPGFFDYPFSKSDVQQCTALLNVIPEALASRMKHLESGLTGDRRVTVYVDVDGLARRIDAVPGIAGVRLWDMPLLAEQYKVAMDDAAERDPVIKSWYLFRWAIMDAPVITSQSLSRGRWRHLLGQFDTNEDESVEGARTLYLTQRKPEFEIAKLNIDVNLQKTYGIRRELGSNTADYQRQIYYVQDIMRRGKRTATYWLSLIQYDDQRYETAESWLVKRVLGDDQQSVWEPAAKYNLARTLERLGESDRAIELYKSDQSPQEHGNRIRARLVARAAK